MKKLLSLLLAITMVAGIAALFPVFADEVKESTSFSEGSLEGDTVSTTGISGFVSSRVGTVADTSDLRFILAVDLEAAKTYGTFDVAIEFSDENGVVKTFALSFEELVFYLRATAADKVYTAADGDAIFGAVVCSVPNTAWDFVKVTVTLEDGSEMSGTATTEILGYTPETPDLPTDDEGHILYNTGIDIVKDATLSGEAKTDNGYLDLSAWGTKYATYTVSGNYEGQYQLIVYYADPAGWQLNVQVNGVTHNQQIYGANDGNTITPSWNPNDGTKTHTFIVDLVNGDNTIVFGTDGYPMASIAKFELVRVGYTLEEPETPDLPTDDEGHILYNTGIDIVKDATLSGEANTNNGYLDLSPWGPAKYATYTVSGNYEGQYELIIYYADPAGWQLNVQVNGVTHVQQIYGANDGNTITPSWNPNEGTKTHTFIVDLVNGDNTIVFGTDGYPMASIAKFELVRVGYTPDDDGEIVLENKDIDIVNDATLSGEAKTDNGYLDLSAWGPAKYATYTVSGNYEGQYELIIYYADHQGWELKVQVNGVEHKQQIYGPNDQGIPLTTTPSWNPNDGTKTHTFIVDLVNGDNTIVFGTDGYPMASIAKFELVRVQ